MNEACALTNDVFLNFSVDGVSVESNHVRQSIFDFFKNRIEYLGTTDTNHNAKSTAYQVIGGSNICFVGKVPIDADLLRLAKVTQELWRVLDFASDLVVLKLSSYHTTESINKLSINNASYSTLETSLLILTLYFIHLRLHAVNGSFIFSKNRVRYLWSSTLWLISISGVSIVTKRNLVSEMISMSCVILRKEVFRPRALTTESAEHQFGIYRSIIHEFTTLEFLQLHRRTVIRLKSLVRGKLQHSREPSKGYQSTFHDFCTQQTFYEEKYKCHGPADKDLHPDEHISDTIWTVLVPIVNTSIIEVTDLLQVFSAKLLHPKFFQPMKDKKDLIEAYLNISPSISFQCGRKTIILREM